MEIKICTKCKKEKLISEFTKDKQKKDGLRPSCKECSRKYHKSPDALAKKHKWRKNSKKYKQTSFKNNLWHNFNLTVEQYNKMLSEQNEVCKICSGINLSGRRLGVDHNHETGKIRGLLCARCNYLLGVFEDREFTKKAKQYLKGYSD